MSHRDRKRQFKQTEIGLLPEDWEVSVGSELSQKITKGASPRWQGFEYKKHGVLFVTSENVQNSKLDIGQPKYLDESFNEKQKNSQLKYGDLLIVIVGASIGRVCIYDLDISANTNQAVCLIRPNDRIDRLYFLYCLQSSQSQTRLIGAQTESARPNLSLADIRNFQIPLPSLPEQTAIATALSDTDALLTKLDQLLTKKRNIKQAAMQRLLAPKEGWEVKTIFELAENRKEFFNYGDWIESEHIVDEGIRLIQTGNIGVGVFNDKSTKKYISENSFLKLNCKEVKIGDILICRLAEPAGRACIMREIGEQKMITAVDITIFRPINSLTNRDFLISIFSTKQWFNQISERCGGSTRTRIARGALGKIQLSLPPLPEQNRIANILTDLNRDIEALEKKIAKYKAVKTGMMQNLLTGKIRLV